MSRLGNLLIEEIREEVDFLFRKVFSKMVSVSKYKTNDVLAILKKDDLNINDVSVLLGSRYGKLVSKKYSDEELIDYLKEMKSERKLSDDFDKSYQYLTIPVYKYLLSRDNQVVVRDACSLFMDMHCTKDLAKQICNNFNNRVGFDELSFRNIDGIEHLFNVPTYSVSMKEVFNLLSFINFERGNKIFNEEYRDLLNTYYDNVYAFLDFTSSKEFMNLYDSLGGNVSKGSFIRSDDNLDLVKFYYGEEFNKYSNSFYSFKKMEKVITEVSDPLKRKEMLLAIFCYRDYHDNDFFDDFSDVFLDCDDLYNFIKKYEDAGFSFTDRQFKKLLTSFRNRYLVENDLVDLEKDEKAKILEFYKDFYNDNFAFTSSEFIDKYNILYQPELRSFNFSSEFDLLNRDILRFILQDEFVGFEFLNSTQAMKNYLRSLEYHNLNDEEIEAFENSLKDSRSRFFNNYYQFVEMLALSEDETVGYFMRKVIVPEDKEMFLELVNWYSSNTGYVFDSDDVKRNCAERLKNDLLEEVETNPFNKRRETLKRYKEYIESDGLSDFITPTKLAYNLKKYTDKYISNIRQEVLRKLVVAYENKEDLYEAIRDYNLLSSDVSVIINHFTSSPLLLEAYKKSESSYKAKVCGDKFILEQKEKEKKQMEILGEFVLSDSADFVSFCCSRGIGKIWAEEFFARSLRKENSEGLDEIEKLCSSKIRKQREELVHLDNREKIVSRIINGVERRDGSIRYYNYFDLLMDEGRVVPFKELKQEMLNNYPEFAKDSFSRSCANQVFSRYEESRQIGVLPVAYSFSSSFADCVLKNDLLVSINKSETHFVTQEEKLVALDFIRAKGFPEFVYYDAIVSYVSGEYNFKELLSKEQGNKVLVKTDSNNN